MVLIVSCEHAHNKVPAKFKKLFTQKQLQSHEGWDIGALDLAKKISSKCQASLFAGQVSPLLIDLNRSLKKDSDQEIVDRYYHPYREDVMDLIDLLVLEKVQVFHLSVHTFTPVLKGKRRECDIGLLFDPSRPIEKAFCEELRQIILEIDPSLNVRFNYPYKGVSDGFTTSLRKRYHQGRYVGIELEVNQKFALGEKNLWENIKKNIATSLEMLFQ